MAKRMVLMLLVVSAFITGIASIKYRQIKSAIAEATVPGPSQAAS